jgi:hypothetical protein
MEGSMKRIVITAALVLGTIAQAQAEQRVVRWYDTIRPHGHKRPDSVGSAALNACAAREGNYEDSAVTDGFRQCMRGFGYRFVDDTIRQSSRRTTTVYNRDSRDPSVGWHTENGLRVCHNDCDNPEIPGSGAVCSDVESMGMPMRQCVTHN